jgi:hypothetical protein
MRGMKPSSVLVPLALGLLGASSGNAAPVVAVETHLVLRIEALTVENGRSKAAGISREAEIGPKQPASVDFVVPWRPDGTSLTVRLDARLTSSSSGSDLAVEFESTTTLAGSPPVAASREIRFADEGSGLFEIFGDNGRRLLLTVQGEKVERAVVRTFTTVGAPVRFVIAVERVDGDRIVLLETNELHTFVGQSVEYSFRQGQGEGLEAVRLSVLPVAISGDLVTIDAEISGALPGAGGTALISRKERIVASRRATSRLAATTGNPPAGYRFQVTPEF